MREAENLHLLKESGASSVIHSAEAVGRLPGTAEGDRLVVLQVAKRD